MALKKDYKFSEELITLSHIAFALSHPARILIIKTLQEQKICSFHDIDEMIPLGSTTVSQHLRALEKVHFIQKAEMEDTTTGYMLHDIGFNHGWGELKTVF